MIYFLYLNSKGCRIFLVIFIHYTNKGALSRVHPDKTNR